MTERIRGLFDTSAIISATENRTFDSSALPDEVAVSVITLGELQAGVHAARDIRTRTIRLETLGRIAHLDVLNVTPSAATEWAKLRALLAEAGKKAGVNDLWIASIALANGLSIVTQDDDFDTIESVGGPPVIRV